MCGRHAIGRFELTILGLAMSVSAAKENVWKIGSQTLPPPVAASDRLREALTATPTPNIKVAFARSPKVVKEWKADIAKQAKGGELVTRILARANASNESIMKH